jgi:hypothetical protein
VQRPEIKSAIRDFLELVSGEQCSAVPTDRALERALDRLALAQHYVECGDDDTDYPDPPRTNQSVRRAAIESRFPMLGCYTVAAEPLEVPCDAGTSTADAIDDLVDIARELEEVAWRWDNTSEDDALWCFAFSYRAHWGKHLRELQLYLAARDRVR